MPADFCRTDTCRERSLSRTEQFLRFLAHHANCHRDSRVHNDAVMREAEIKLHDVALFEHLQRLIRNAVHDFVIYGNAQRRRIWSASTLRGVPQKCRRIPAFKNHLLREVIEFFGGDSNRYFSAECAKYGTKAL